MELKQEELDAHLKGIAFWHAHTELKYSKTSYSKEVPQYIRNIEHKMETKHQALKERFKFELFKKT